MWTENHDTTIVFVVIYLIDKIYKFHCELCLRRTRSGLLHNKVAYIPASRELIHFHYTTYARVLKLMKLELSGSTAALFILEKGQVLIVIEFCVVCILVIYYTNKIKFKPKAKF